MYWISIHGTICPEEQVLSKTPSEVVEVDTGAIVSNLLTKSPSVLCLNIQKLFLVFGAESFKCIVCDMKFQN